MLMSFVGLNGRRHFLRRRGCGAKGPAARGQLRRRGAASAGTEAVPRGGASATARR